MKRLTIYLLALLMLCCLAACTEEAPAETPTPTPEVVEASATPAPTPVPKWKDLTKEYEAWVDAYIQTYKDAMANPTDNALYDKLEEMGKETEKWDKRLYTQEMSMVDDPQLQDFVDEVLRITKKLSDFVESQSV